MLLELQMAEEVRIRVEASEKVPVATNCLLLPTKMVGFAGVTAMDTKVALVTVNVVFPDTRPKVAVITEVPGMIPVARPLVAVPLAFRVATAGVAELQMTVDVRF